MQALTALHPKMPARQTRVATVFGATGFVGRYVVNRIGTKRKQTTCNSTKLALVHTSLSPSVEKKRLATI